MKPPAVPGYQSDYRYAVLWPVAESPGLLAPGWLFRALAQRYSPSWSKPCLLDLDSVSPLGLDIHNSNSRSPLCLCIFSLTSVPVPASL